MKVNIDVLEQVQKVEPSPFLYFQILKKIEKKRTSISTKEVVIYAVPSFLILLITCFLVFQRPSIRPSTDLVKSMHLIENNSLY